MHRNRHGQALLLFSEVTGLNFATHRERHVEADAGDVGRTADAVGSNVPQWFKCAAIRLRAGAGSSWLIVDVSTVGAGVWAADVGISAASVLSRTFEA